MTCCIRWVGMLSGYPQKIMKLKTKYIRELRLRKTLPDLKNSFLRLDLHMIGVEKSTLRIRNITNGHSGFSCNYIKKDWRMNLLNRLIGAHRAKQGLRMKT